MNTQHPISVAPIMIGAILYLLAAGSLVQAQNELDANLQRGSGGTNPTSTTRNFSAGNDVITGNVPGLGYFHGSVGYGAPGEFGGSLGSDALFRFRARSLSSTPSQIPGVITLGSVPGQERVYRSRAINSSVGDLGQASNWNNTTVQYESAGLISRPARPMISSTTEPTTPTASLMESYQQRIGVVSQSEGRLLEVTASPLLGIRHRRIEQTTNLLAGQMQDQETTADQPTEEQSTPSAPQSRFFLPAVRLGQQLQDLTNQPQATDRPDEPIDAIETELFRSLGGTPRQPGQDIYQDLLIQIQKDGDETHPPPNQPDRQVETGSFKPASLTTPSDQQVAHAQERWRRIQRPKSIAKDDEDGSQTQQADQPPNRLQSLLKKLDYDLPRIRTLAGKKDTTINNLILQAQQEIQSRRYLDAQERYRHVLQLRPEDPMARVGLLHSQIGAGMFRSAQINLRWLFERHPELIAARYDSALMPDHERLEWISDELIKMVEATRQAEPALVLAYLGYQNESSKIVMFALDIAGADSPDDPLIVLLRRIWLEEKTAPAATPETNRQK